MPMIHNAGRQIGEKKVARKITFPKGWDKDGNPVKEGKKILQDTIAPGQHKEVTKEQYAHLKEIFGNEIVNVDDLKDMQKQFTETPPAAPRPSYVAPEDVEALVAKRVADELAKSSKDTDSAKGTSEKVKETPRAENDSAAPKMTPESREALVAKIDAMDRADLVAFIEQEGLGVEHKNYKQIGSLKSATLTAIENREAAKSEAA